MWASLQIINFSGQDRGGNAFKGSVWIIYISIYRYSYILPCLQVVGRLWLDGCGDLIQLWILMNPFLYEGRENRKLNGAKVLQKCLWCHTRGQLESDVTQSISKLSLGLGRDFCHPRGQVASHVLRSSSVLVFPYSKAQSQTPKKEEKPNVEKLCSDTGRAYYLLGQYLLTFLTLNPHPDRSRTGKTFLPHIKRPKDFFFPLLALLWKAEVSC